MMNIKYVTGIMAIFIGSFLFTSAYVYAMPTNEELQNAIADARHSESLLSVITVLTSRCVDSIQQQDYSIIDACIRIMHNMDTHLTSTFSESKADMNTIKNSIAGMGLLS